MPQTKKVTLPSSFISNTDQTGVLKINVPNLGVVDIRFGLNVGEHPSVFFDRPESGDLMLQEFWENIGDKIYFDVNSQGELIAIFPEGMDGYIDGNGDLIIIQN